MTDVFVHPTAVVESSDIGPNTRIWAFAHVLPGARIGENCNLGDHVFVEGAAVVGNNVTLKNGVSVWDGIRIEDDVFVGPNATFTNDRFPRSPRMPEVRQRYSSPDNWLEVTRVERGCTIGANATILPGVTLGEYCFVAAGAVVSRDVEPFTLVAGSPAQPIGNVCRCGHRLAPDALDIGCENCGHIPETNLHDVKRVFT